MTGNGVGRIRRHYSSPSIGTGRRSPRLQEFVADRRSERDPAVLAAVAETFWQGGELDRAEALLREALDLYTRAGETARARVVRTQLIDLLLAREKFGEAVPELERHLVENDTVRAEVVTRLRGSTDFTQSDLDALLAKVGRRKGTLDTLSRAYLEGKDGTPGSLIASINLSWILQRHHPEERRHDAAYIAYVLRQARAWYELGVDFGRPQALDSAIALLQNGIVLVGLEERYERTVPGSRAVIRRLLADAEAARARY